MQQTIQQQFFGQIAILVGHRSLAKELAKVLGISLTQVYSRLNGNSSLSLQEAQSLCQAFGVFLEIGPGHFNHAPVQYQHMYRPEFSVKDWLKGVLGIMESHMAKADTTLWCATDDIPIFRFFHFPLLSAFKTFMWQHHAHPLLYSHFKPAMAAPAELKMLQRLYAVYGRINSMEIWSHGAIEYSIGQIELAVQTNLLKDEGLLKQINAEFEQLLNQLEADAGRGCKDKGGMLHWFRVKNVGNIVYLLQPQNGSGEAFLRFNTFNFLRVTDAALYNEMHQWVIHLRQDSEGLSDAGATPRREWLYNCINRLHKI